MIVFLISVICQNTASLTEKKKNGIRTKIITKFLKTSNIFMSMCYIYQKSQNKYFALEIYL